MNVERFGFHISTHGCEIDVLISSRIRCTCKYPSVLVDLKINWNQDQRFLAPQPRICTFFLLRDYFSSPVDASDTTTVANSLLSLRLAGIKPFWPLSSLDMLFLLPAWPRPWPALAGPACALATDDELWPPMATGR